MERIYLLLRNNIELGPFTLSELAEQSLRPSDLIWIKGESRVWSDASALRNVPTPQTTTRREDEDRSLATAKARGKNDENSDATLVGHTQEHNQRNNWDARTLQMPDPRIPTEKFRLIIHKKNSGTVSLSQLLLATLICTIILWVWRSPSAIISPGPKENVTYAAQPAVFVPDSTPTVSRAPFAKQTSRNPTAETVVPVFGIGDSGRLADNSSLKKNRISVTTPRTNRKGPTAVKPPPVTETQPLLVEVPMPTPVLVPEVSTDTGSSLPVEVEKKKTLKQVMRNLFKKKKKKESTTGEDTSFNRSQPPS